MLVLSRKESEQLYIGPDIVITVIQTEEGRVRLGIQAPEDVKIHRDAEWKRKDEAVEA